MYPGPDQDGNKVASAQAEIAVDCTEPPAPEIELVKKILRPDGSLNDSGAILPGEVVELTDPDNGRVFEGVFTTPNDPAMINSAQLRLCVTCDLIQRCSDGLVLIDPEGAVFDITQGKAAGLLAGAVVACQEEVSGLEGEETTFNLWPAADFDQVNPQTTASDGYFSFFTPAGTYRVTVGRSGYQPYQSPDLVVVDEPVHYDVPLSPEITEAADYTVTIGPLGFDPPVLTVEPGAIVEWINVDSAARSTRSLTPTVASRPAAPIDTDAWDSGLLQGGEHYKRQLTASGTYSYQDDTNPLASGQITVGSGKKVYLPLISR